MTLPPQDKVQSERISEGVKVQVRRVASPPAFVISPESVVRVPSSEPSTITEYAWPPFSCRLAYGIVVDEFEPMVTFVTCCTTTIVDVNE